LPSTATPSPTRSTSPEPARSSSTSPGTASGRTRRVRPRRRADRTARLNRAGTTHLSLAVDDLDAVSEQLPADVETLSEPRTTSSGTRILVRDPAGNLIELLEA
jgi:catechol 2,3-dioxygenase-like lactoylglutathione lyase family enzyme